MAERLNFRQAVARAGVSRQRLNEAITSGRLPAVRGGGPGKPTHIDLADLQAWCVSEGLAMPVESLERSERLQSEDLHRFFDQFQQMIEAIARLELQVEHIIERFERSQTQAIAQGIRQVLEEFRVSTPFERLGTSRTGSPASRLDRESLITRIRQAKDDHGQSYQQIANALNAEGISTFSGKGQWQKGTVERFYKGRTD